MEEAIFPPSPSWFLPNIIDTKEDGSVGYGSKNNIIILQPVSERKLEMVVIQGAHSSRVTGVAFSPSLITESLQNTIVSCSEDSFVKLWNIESLVAIMGHKCHSDHIEDSGKVVSINWSIANPRHIVSVADNNTLVLWDVLSNTTIKFNFPKLGATVISCCPYNDKVVAVGRKTGEIFVISLIDSGNIIYKLRGHDNKIHSLSWCPIPYNIFKKDQIVEEFLLASGCQNKEIFIWRVGSDGKCENKFHIPTNPLSTKDSQHYGRIKNSFSYLCLNWLEPFKLFTSSNFGELIYVDFKSSASNKSSYESSGKGKSNKKSTHSIKLVHCFHNKGLFAIAGLPVKSEVVLYKPMSVESKLRFPIISNCISSLKSSENKTSDCSWDVTLSELSSLLWTAGQDRKLIACKVKSSKIEKIFNCHTLNGFVYCAVASPHDPNKIAIGVGDGMIRLLNLTELFGDIQVYWQKIKDRVMCLDWHPKKDGLLAYGTSEGRVGMIDTTSNKLPSVFKPSHPQPIYNLSWGPEFHVEQRNSISDVDFDLYCVGNNIISVYQPSKLNADPINLSKIIPFPCNKQTEVCWKPDYSLLAVGNEDGSICLVEPFEFKIVHTVLAYKKLIQSIAWHPTSTSIDTGISPFQGYFTSGSTDNSCQIKVFNCIKEESKVKVDQVATLKGHHGHIQSVSWSPHIGGRLISCSADGSVQIWDVISQSPLVNFSPIGMPVFSIWSPIKPDCVFTGCKNDILCVWDTSGQLSSHPSSNKLKKQKKNKELNFPIPKELIAKDAKVGLNLKSAETKILAIAETKTIIKNSKELKMFSKVWENEDIKNCYNMLKNEPQKNTERSFSLSFLCSEEYFKASIKAEEEMHKKSNNWNEFAELALWSGSIKEVLEERIVNGQLNDFLVSLAPSISPRLWHEACLSYSNTLAEKKFYRKAASYLIICHKIYEAIRLLCDACLFLEALCIARSRLPRSDPVFNEVIRKYAEWLFKNGSFIKACECYIALGEYLEVAKICGKKNQAEYLSLAALAAKRNNSFDLEVVEATNAVFKCLETKNFNLAEQVCSDHSNLNHLSLINFTYQTINQLDNEEIKLNEDILSYIKKSFKTEDVIFPDSLPKLFHKYSFYKQKEQVLMIVAQELSFAVCVKENEDEKVIHITKALSTCNRYIPNKSGETHLAFKLCEWLSPEGHISENSFFNVNINLSSTKLKSLRAFLGASIVRHLSEDRGSRDNSKWFDFLVRLKEDLLDAESYKYFQNLIEIELVEKRLLKNRSLLSSKALENGKNIVACSDETNNVQSSLDPISEYEKTENSGTESDSKVNVQNDSVELLFESSQIYTEEYSSGKICLDESSKTVTSLEADNEDDLGEKISKDFDLLKKLKSEVEQFEARRVSSPNPVPVYFMLKKLCEEFPEDYSANFLLNYLGGKWKDLN